MVPVMKDMEKTPRFTIVLSVEHSEKDLSLCLDSLANLDYRKDAYRIAVREVSTSHLNRPT